MSERAMEEWKDGWVKESGIGSETGEREETMNETWNEEEIGWEVRQRRNKKRRKKKGMGVLEVIYWFPPRFNPILRLTFKSTNV